MVVFVGLEGPAKMNSHQQAVVDDVIASQVRHVASYLPDQGILLALSNARILWSTRILILSSRKSKSFSAVFLSTITPSWRVLRPYVEPFRSYRTSMVSVVEKRLAMTIM